MVFVITCDSFVAYYEFEYNIYIVICRKCDLVWITIVVGSYHRAFDR